MKPRGEIGQPLVIIFVLCGLVAGPQALERTASMPTTALRAAPTILPTCGPMQYLTTNNNRLECRNFPTCGANEVLSTTGGTLQCVASSQGQVGAVTVVSINDASTSLFTTGFRSNIHQVETHACPANHTLVSCSGGIVAYGSSTGTDFESQIIAPIMDAGNQRCRMTYDHRHGSGINLRELYAYCMRTN